MGVLARCVPFLAVALLDPHRWLVVVFLGLALDSAKTPLGQTLLFVGS